MRPFVWRLIYHQGVGLEHRLYLNQLGMNKQMGRGKIFILLWKKEKRNNDRGKLFLSIR